MEKRIDQQKIVFHVIDSNFIDRYMAEYIIKSATLSFALSIRHYSTGMAALEAVERGEFINGIVLLDISIPAMNGWGFLQKFRARGNKESVFILTDLVLEEDKRLELMQLSDGILIKPLGKHDVIKIINIALKK